MGEKMERKISLEEHLRFLNEQLSHCKEESKIHQLKNLILCLQDLMELERRESELLSQARLIECDDKPVNVRLMKKRRLEEGLRDAYCYKCASPELKITKTIQIECRKCGRKRLITTRLDESKR